MSPPNTSNTRYSLQTRLVLAFGILLILFLGLAGLVLDRAFKESVAAAVEERLQLQINALIGVAVPEGNSFFIPDLEEARFSQINSGLYGFILDNNGREIWRSPSALNLFLDPALFSGRQVRVGETVHGSVETEEQGRLSYASYGTYWSNLDLAASFVVMESVAPTTAEIREFQSNLYLWFGGLAILLSIIQLLLLRWGTRPLQQLAADVSRIESGELDQLTHDYPAELQAVSSNLNLLIKSERERQSRYRTTLGDLAHSLKTPLAVISSLVQELKSQPDSSKSSVNDMEEQLQRMNQIVSYQLNRAAKSESVRHFGKAVQVEPVIRKILAALEKVYLDKQVQVDFKIQADAIFQGEESDLMELSGNLLDNAFKYCHQQVKIRIEIKDDLLVMEFEDDGAGIPEEKRQWVLKRGARADTIKSGQGIGLAVAVDIISSYQGAIDMDSSPLGGAKITVSL